MTHNRSVSPQAAQIRRDGGWCSGWSNNEFRLNWIQSKPAAPNSKNVLQSWAAFNLFKCLDSRNDQLRLVRFLVDQTSSPSSRMVVHDRMLPKNLYQFVWQRISQSLVKWDLKVQGYQPTPLAKNLINIKMLLGPFPNSHDLSQTFSSCRLGFLLLIGTKRPRAQIQGGKFG